jgi:tripartite-type tricarboxylate transporter receptor subunit TctC
MSIVLAMVSHIAHAQTYPARAVRIISPFAAGGSNDVIARIVGQKMAELTGQQFIIDNRPGAGGIIGTDLGAKAAPDGYTVTMVTSTMPITAAMRPLPYDPVKDFAPVGLVGLSPYILLVNPSVPVRTVKDLVTLARARPGELEFGSGGVGTPGHLAGEMLKTMTKIRMTHVPYKAGSLALNDLLGGHIAMTFSTTITSTQLVKAGKVRALAVTTAHRIPAFPDILTVAESGVPGYDFTLWLGLAVPAGTPPANVQQLSALLTRVLQTTQTRELLAAQSVDALMSTPEEFSQKIKRDMGVYAKLVKESGARAD